MSACLARLAPGDAKHVVSRLYQRQLPVLDALPMWQQATHMTSDLSHHMFDTSYHATALHSDSVLITANRYLNKAAPLGQIADLAN